MKIYSTLIGFLLMMFALAVFASCRKNNISTVPQQSIKISAPSNTPNSKQENKTQNMNQSKVVPPGNWGATGISLVVGETGVKIEYDCAFGEIKQKLTVNENGEFEADGFHTPEGFGPVREDKPPKSQPAHFSGKISGNQMTLAVTLTDTKEKIADFTLERDKAPRLRKCR